MRVILTQAQLCATEFQSELARSAVGVTVGNFDGMHLGHQKLFVELEHLLNDKSRLLSKPAYRVLLTFNPHPRALLKPSEPHQKTHRQILAELALTSFRERIIVAERLGFDALVVLHFTPSFARLSAESFVQKFLADALKASVVVIGHDFHFGYERKGNPDYLVELGRTHGFDTKVVDPFLVEGVRISSSFLKQLIAQGEIEEVIGFLGRPYSIFGRVVHGVGRGRQLGFPTANVSLSRYLLPKDGVYACYAVIEGKRYDAVANVGKRPTFDEREVGLEVHILDWNGSELYNKRISVEFLKRLRDELRFRDQEELKAAIAQDIEATKKLFRL